MQQNQKINKYFSKKVVIAFITLLAIGISTLLIARIYKKDSGIIFNHKIHIVDNEITCDQCHEPSEKSSRQMTFPDHELCGNCHGDEIEKKSEKKCSMCHSQTNNKTNLRKNVDILKMVNFDHKKHLAKKIKCEQCHTKATENTSISANEMLPKMGQCVECHEEKNIVQGKDCYGCHPNNYQKKRPISHTATWLSYHGKGLDEEKIDNTCKVCHNVKSGNDCLTCHRREKPRNHNIAWRIRGHANKAQVDRESCATCHNQASCIACHSQNPPFSHTASWGSPLNRHCATCHIDGSNSSYGIGRNCGFCHGNSLIVRHLNAPSMSVYPSENCLSCHTSGSLRPKHPLPAETACRACHK